MPTSASRSARQRYGVRRRHVAETFLLMPKQCRLRAGHLLTDEPKVAGFAQLANWSRELASVRPELLRFTNLLPNYAPVGSGSIGIGAPSYDAYIARYIAEVKPQLLCVDVRQRCFLDLPRFPSR